MIDFAKTNSLTLFDGITNKNVIKVEDIDTGKVLWEQFAEPDEPTEPVEPAKTFNYVSLGDSIAVGHRIDEKWETDYGWDAQYRKTDPKTGKVLTETVLIPNCYTDKISKYLQGVYGESNVSTKSFAVSGSMIYRKHGDNRSLIEILDDEPVNAALSKADLVTVSIGANSILEAGLDRLPSFLTEGGSLDDLEKTVEYNLRQLEKTDYTEEVSFSGIKAWDILIAYKSDGKTDNIYVDRIENNVLIGKNLDTGKSVEIKESTYNKFDRQIYSYKRLFDKLTSINPNAKYVFPTVHNPMKYLYAAKGTWDNNFQDSLLATWLNTISGDASIANPIKNLILSTQIITDICGRINGDGKGWEGISAWTERYIADGGISTQDGKPFTSLNGVIRQSIEAYNNPNIVFTETHELFDTVPDRQGAGELHYNDLVNMQITRGYDANNLDWSKLWGEAEGNNPDEKIRNYWEGIIAKYTSGLTVDFDGLVAELEPIIVDCILSEAFDPHPRLDGHYAMYRSFADTLRENFPEEFQSLPDLKTITYNANGGTGTMGSQKVLDNSIVNNARKRVYSIINANAFKPQAHYHFTGWKANDGNSYSDKQAIFVPTNIVLSAQWGINTHTLTVVQGAPDATSKARLFSRDYSNRQLDIGGYSRYLNSNKTTWDLPLKDTQTFEVAYGLPIKMKVTGNVEWITDIHLGEAPRPNCSISQYVGGTTYDPKVTAKVAEASFTMPDRDITIEYHFNYSANMATVYSSPYSHSYWLGYIGDKDLDVTYLASDN